MAPAHSPAHHLQRHYLHSHPHTHLHTVALWSGTRHLWLRATSEVQWKIWSVTWGEREQCPPTTAARHVYFLKGWLLKSAYKPNNTQENVHEKSSKWDFRIIKNWMELLAPGKETDSSKPPAPKDSRKSEFRCYHTTSKYALFSGWPNFRGLLVVNTDFKEQYCCFKLWIRVRACINPHPPSSPPTPSKAEASKSYDHRAHLHTC